MKKIIRLTETDLARIVKRVISEQIVDPTNKTNAASTTSVNKLPTNGGPKPVNLAPKGCLKGYVMDKTQKYYQKMDKRGYEEVKGHPSGKWSKYSSYPNPNTTWGIWNCSGDKILFDLPGTGVGKEISISNGDTTNPGNWKSIKGKIVSKTPQPQFNSYQIQVKGVGICASTMTSYLTPTGSGSFEQFSLEVENC